MQRALDETTIINKPSKIYIGMGGQSPCSPIKIKTHVRYPKVNKIVGSINKEEYRDADESHERAIIITKLSKRVLHVHREQFRMEIDGLELVNAKEKNCFQTMSMNHLQVVLTTHRWWQSGIAISSPLNVFFIKVYSTMKCIWNTLTYHIIIIHSIFTHPRSLSTIWDSNKSISWKRDWIAHEEAIVD